jgi:flagellar basal-body rod protein FlgC
MSLSISPTGMAAQRIRLNVIAHNLANVNTTRTAEGEPYRRRTVLFSSVNGENSFADLLAAARSGEGGVCVTGVVEDTSEDAFIRIYDPRHPDADDEGFVDRPNINPVTEMVHLMEAVRAFEANVAAFNAARQMGRKALEIGA